MTAALKIAIVGYGIAGIAAAVRFRRLGHHITHFDRNNPPVSVGAGMLLHPSAQRQLHDLGVLADAMACSAKVRRICAQTLQGRPIMDFGYADVVSGQFGLGIQRGTLHRVLAGADDGRNQVRGGREITSLDPYSGYLFENPETRHGPYDLMIIADGAHSRLRHQIQPSVHRPDPIADSAALVSLLDDPDRLVADRLMQFFDGARHLSVWPAGPEFPNGKQKCSIAMNVSLAEATAIREQGTWRNLAVQLYPDIGELVNDHVDNECLHIFTYRDVELSQCAVGRAVVIGDAAHSMSPQLGNGAQLAMEDAATLAAAVSQHSDLSTALPSYARTRRVKLRHYQRASRWLTPLFQSDSAALAAVRDNLFANAMRLPSVKRLAHALLG